MRLVRLLCFFPVGFSILLLGACLTMPERKTVTLTEGVDASAGDVSCYIITTPTATYFLEKEGGGLSSLLDKDGIDWIGFHKDKGTESKGEFRGFPNAIHNQDGSYFHAKNEGTAPSSSKVEIDSQKLVQIRFVSGNGKWEGRWSFFRDRCDFEMIKVSPGYHYWILYEGVPGGSLDKSDFWYSSKDGNHHSIDEKQNDDLPGPEWMAFGDANSPRMIYLLNHWDDAFPDSYYNMRDEMTVFGFARQGGQKFLDGPGGFSIGLVETTDHGKVARLVEQILSKVSKF